MSGCETLHHDNCFLDLGAFPAEFRQHFQDVHRDLESLRRRRLPKGDTTQFSNAAEPTRGVLFYPSTGTTGGVIEIDFPGAKRVVRTPQKQFFPRSGTNTQRVHPKRVHREAPTSNPVRAHAPPRGAAVAGVIFSVLMGTSLTMIRLSAPDIKLTRATG